jgi:UDP-2,3-diacylglucosamine pyrophosphatase LpxH
MKRPAYKSVFISDVHLGTKGCKAQKLHRFLDSFTAENLFLVGDIIDGWALRRRHHWPKTHTEIIRRILKMSERINVVYLPGNHDEFVRPFLKEDMQIGSINIVDSYEYEGVYVTHGDRFDWTMRIPTPLLNFLAHIWDYIPHSDSQSSFTDIMYKWMGTERNIVRLVQRKGYKSCLTGHTDSPKIRDSYMNCGDWVSNCSYIVHHENDTWELKFYDQV